ncbi:Holliday junction branch migration protein RuvA [Ligilactobacillus aviarius]|uniref:Holliday junction branch migration complex subunit RuvA n=1 Tax=Ligilactobacillus aviarius TaxID=1606 RepID=A0A510WQZ1_9LACO|nr:Holliday junction branch migration protein RuvA [Ligilactobacillus aviarius]KRM38534.1 Holliday junction DNA helicase RuvA [Ligilactobacillus aviarius subsp. aviarius DSM 20655]GEK41638.1 Holliday junction ATP-dependent DNA helicase RuvA [Ligilactobacillus aviarius]HJH33756.1 Holliday junction branch migration protein RuvA [Ligilactobacillus aviarius]
MYEYLIGKITAINPHYIVVEVNGIGYQLQVANPFRYEENTTQKVYVYQAVRENDVTLYGFYDLAEKQLFLKLISVSGIGPKSALAILATNDQGGFVAAINADDEAYLTKFPSIGKKTAKQIILDLKGKMDDIETPTPMVDQQNLALDFDDEQPYLKEALEAMLSLGYTKTEVKKVSQKLKDFQADSTDAYLSAALKLVLKK